MNKIDINNSAELVRKSVFSTRDAASELKITPAQANALLFRLTKQGKIIRVKRGLFCIVPPGVRDNPKGYPCNWYLIVRSLMGKLPYYISHYSAMHLHGMTAESVQTVFASCARQLRVPASVRIPVRLITVPAERFWGIEEKWITNEERARVSDLERTIIDSLDRLDLTGGLSELARGVWLVKGRLNPGRLVEYAGRFRSYAAAKRLGFLMEELQIGSGEEIERLRQFISESASYAPLDPTRQNAGHYVHRWRLRVNYGPDELKKNLMT